MLNRILCVDDEPNVLHAFERQLRKQYDVQTASGPEIGLEKLTAGPPFAVVVSDMRMPVMDGAEFLGRVREKWPDTVRVMLTGQADLTSAIAAVNHGNVFQFLQKPCPGDVLERALQAAVAQHRLVTAERELLEGTLQGSIGVMSEILSLVNPPAFGRAQRIRRYVRCMAETLNLPGRWQYEMAAMLSQIGCVTVPPDVLAKHHAGQSLNDGEKQILGRQGKVGRDLLARIPRLEVVAEMVANQAAGTPEEQALPEVVRRGAQLLRAALELDEAISRGGTLAGMLSQMKKGKAHDPAILSALEKVHLEAGATEARCVSLTQIKSGMILNYDVVSKTGLLLLGKGQEITHSAIARLRGFAVTIGVVEPINVLVPHGETDAPLLRAASAN
jgi:CheY-like chemotaxis protein